MLCFKVVGESVKGTFKFCAKFKVKYKEIKMADTDFEKLIEKAAQRAQQVVGSAQHSSSEDDTGFEIERPVIQKTSSQNIKGEADSGLF